MTAIAYDTWNPGVKARKIITTANAICEEYRRQGYDLTLRQLYYQFVSRDLLPNKLQAYKQLGDIVNKARLAGLMDWAYIVDRTRSLKGTSHWDSPASVIEAAAYSYRIDKWADQPARVEVWVEKEALAGVVERSAAEHDVDWFACRGYVSQSEQWAASQRFLRYLKAGQRVIILHLGDHDPSGIDMTRDITDRLTNFVYHDWYRANRRELREAMRPDAEVTFRDIRDHLTERLSSPGEPIEVRRIALNMDQVEQYDPPPNPAKLTDSRCAGYVEEYGDESWELDALDPATLAGLISEHIEGIRDHDLAEAAATREDGQRDTLQNIAQQYDEVAQVFGR